MPRPTARRSARPGWPRRWQHDTRRRSRHGEIRSARPPTGPSTIFPTPPGRRSRSPHARTSTGDLVERAPERRIGHRHAVRVVDLDRVAATATEDREGHRDTMVAVRDDPPAEWGVTADDHHPIWTLLDHGSNRTEVGDRGGDAVALFDPELLGARNHGLAFGMGGQAGEERQLVDHRRDFTRPHSYAPESGRTYVVRRDLFARLGVARRASRDRASHR